ncbi:MAG: wax ester/triacylglycerol synthase domain-containing protein [Solirubrobacteraceae bacterium]
MRQLTGLDAQFLTLETSRRSGHFSGLTILDPSTRRDGRLALADVQSMIAARLTMLTPFRWRLREVPFGFDYLYWIDDLDFDLGYHARELALPAPPTDAKLAEQVARIIERPLDCARPLWELYVVHGLDNGKVGLLTKVHHALVDGMSGGDPGSAARF